RVPYTTLFRSRVCFGRVHRGYRQHKDRGKKNSCRPFYRHKQSPLDWLAMDMREQVWSPLQNTAVWIGAWLCGHEPADDVLAALGELGGVQRLVSTPEDPATTRPFIDALAIIRESTSELDAADGPILRLVLSGPGDPPALPAGSPATVAAADNGQGALIVRTKAGLNDE